MGVTLIHFKVFDGAARWHAMITPKKEVFVILTHASASASQARYKM